MQKSNEDLDQGVMERTRQLAKAIEELKHEIAELKKADEQKEFEQRDKEALINATDDILWSVSSDFRLLAANKAFIREVETFTGVTLKPGDKVLIPDVIPADILAFWKDAYNKALSGETFKKEIYTPAFNKIPLSWTETFFNPIYKDKIIVAIACYSRNITERKFAEERLRQSEAHLAEAQRLAKLGSWDFDIKADRLIWSEELYNVFGTDKQTFIETHGSFLDLVDAEDREFALQTSRHTQHTGESFTIEYHITTPKGERRVIQEHGYGQRDDNGKIVRLFGTAQDITEQKKAESKLKDALVQQSLFKAIVNSSEDAIISKTLDGIITSWNRGAETIFGYTQKEAVGNHITLIIPSDLKIEEQDIIAKIKKGDYVEHFETERVKKDGSRVSISLTISPILDSNGVIIGASKIARDISERKRAEEELRQINEELHSLSAHLQNIREEERIQIARDVHDELGQKLTGLKMEINCLNIKLNPQDEIIQQKMHSITELIDETLKSIRKISSDLRPSLLDNIGLIAALEWHSEEMAKRSEIKVNFSGHVSESDIPVAMATSIFRIYQELLTNAVRHANAHVINSSLRLNDNHLNLRIKDDGQGMDPEITGTKKTWGLIGIKERTFALGGKYDLKSELGNGTEVQISIPL